MGLGEAMEWAVSFTHSVHPDTAKFRAMEDEEDPSQSKQEPLQCLSYIEHAASLSALTGVLTHSKVNTCLSALKDQNKISLWLPTETLVLKILSCI